MSNELNASIQVSSTTNGKTRVLLIVEACNPTWTSVPLVGYNFARALVEREDLELTIATHVRNEEAIRDDEIFKLAKW
ncbi:MAG: putative fused transcriptional regulator/phosphomethylpyrimidine kinase, partial [Pirellulaceae bacterium]